MNIRYSSEERPDVDSFIDVLRRSTLAERRPVDDRECMEGMVQHADLFVTAWSADRLIGVSRSVTDFHYSCYLSDLAVDRDFQGQGIGRELLARTRAALGPQCFLNLLSAPAATEYYPRIGMTQHDSAWILKPGQDLAE